MLFSRTLPLGALAPAFLTAPLYADSAHNLPVLEWVQDLEVRDRQGHELKIKSLTATINSVGPYTETLMHFALSNESKRQKQGEFIFTIPKGARISQLNLEVNGKMREGVSHPKKLARIAYERTVSRRIDPALVEYLTPTTVLVKVFPIPAEGLKEVSIGYIEKLEKKDGAYRYSLPLQINHTVEKFEVKIADESLLRQVSKVKTKYHTVPDDRPNKDTLFTANNWKPHKQKIEFALTPSDKAEKVTFRDRDNNLYYWIDQPLVVDEKTSPLATDFNLVWDTSLSTLGQDREKLISTLDALFQKNPDCKVTLYLMNHQFVNSGSYNIKNGNWKDLRTKLLKTTPDGASIFQPSKILDQKIPTILCSDGRFQIEHNTRFAPTAPLFLLNANKQKCSNAMKRVLESSGGDSVHLLGKAPKAVIETICKPAPSITPSQDNGSTLWLDYQPNTMRVAALGATRTGDPIKLSINDKPLTIPLEGSQTNSLVKKIWAHQELDRIERFASAQDAHGHIKKHWLFTRTSSLIVLDRFQDYLTYNIAPPEPELKAKYNRLKMASNYKGFSPEHAWNNMVKWDEKQHLWIDSFLQQEYFRLLKWSNAQKTVFKGKSLAGTNNKEINDWLQNCKTTLLERPNPDLGRTAQNTYMKKVHATFGLREKVFSTPVKANATQKVSVRGAVKTRGLVDLNKGCNTLLEAVYKAGLLDGPDTLITVELYRNGRKTTYSTFSSEYTPVRLLPGDMLVVLGSWRNSSLGAGGFANDPFGGDSMSAGPDSSAPAVAPTPSPKAGRVRNKGIDLERNQKTDHTISPPTTINKEVDVERLVANYLAEVPETTMLYGAIPNLKKLNRSDQLHAIYLKLRLKHLHNANFYLQFAKLLHEENLNDASERILSNALEINGHEIGVKQSLARSAWALGLNKYAHRLLTSLVQAHPSSAEYHWDLAQVDIAMGNNKAAIENLWKIVHGKGAVPESNYVPLALNLLSQLGAFKAIKLQLIKDQKFDCDIRVVATFTHPSSSILAVTTPMDFHLTKHSTHSDYGDRWQGSTVGHGVQEFTIKRAVPGKYRITIGNDREKLSHRTGHVVLDVYRNWQRENQTHERIIHPLNSKTPLNEIITIK